MWNSESDLARYVQFRKDVQLTTRSDVKSWTFKKFVDSGMVRANMTNKKKCYVKQYSGILSVFNKPEILFSFNK